MAQWIDMGKERQRSGKPPTSRVQNKESCRKYATKMQMKAPDGVWVRATLPAAPSVRSAKSRHFSMAK